MKHGSRKTDRARTDQVLDPRASSLCCLDFGRLTAGWEELLDAEQFCWDARKSTLLIHPSKHNSKFGL